MVQRAYVNAIHGRQSKTLRKCRKSQTRGSVSHVHLTRHACNKSTSNLAARHSPFFHSAMSRLLRRPSLLSSLSFALFALLAIVSFCSPAVRAEDADSEYGTVIGIGTWNHIFPLQVLINSS